jgi:hypothetical protein
MTDGELRAWAERMKAALESIVDGVENYDDHEPGDRLSAEQVVAIAQRALNPAEWEYVRE